MAEHHAGEHRLIEEHLTGLRRSMKDRPDVDAVVEELRDHLLAASDHHERAGASAAEADRLAVQDLGAADELAASFARSDRGSSAVPTTFTRAAGITGIAAAISIVFAGAAFAIGDRIEEQDGYWSGAAQAWGAAGAIGTLMATTSLLILLSGVVRRHGSSGAWPVIAIGLGALGALASVIAWAVPVWGTLTALSWVVTAIATRKAGIAPRHALPAVAAALVTVPIAAVASGTWSSSTLIVIDAAALAVAAAGTAVLGRWLAQEEPVDAGDLPVRTA